MTQRQTNGYLKNKQNKSALQNAKLNLRDTKQLIEKLTTLKKEMECSLKIQKRPEKISYSPAKSLRNIHMTIAQRVIERKNEDKKKSNIQLIRENILGFNTQYVSPFNIRLQSVYVDHTATNRPYKPVESLVDHAKRFLANPHTQFSHYGKYSTQMMHYSQNSLLKSFSADPCQYVALPTGSGSTGAIQKAIRMMKVVQNPSDKPHVFLTPYQHHSNILPWIEFYNKPNVLAHDEDGGLDMVKIYDQIKNWQHDDLIISVSGASNVTSQVTDLKSLNTVIKKLRKFKKIIFAVDCAAYCCHHQLNLEVFDQIDFAFLSPHKNLGGAQSCGVLIVRKSVVKGGKPTFPGGGTVAFVKGYNKEDVLYDTDLFNRQVPGTPPFLGFYRAALSFQLLKNQIGYQLIHQRQKQNTILFMKMIKEENKKFVEEKLDINIQVYGNSDFSQRANVITMNIMHKNQVMQHSFISLILADTFGIQLRSGCFCAGPYGMHLLHVDQQMADHLSSVVSVGILKQKPGYLRLDLTFYLEKFEIQYLARAISLTARYCQKMLMVYTICNDGEIRRHKLFKDTFLGTYSLENHYYAEESVKKMLETDQQRLLNRAKTLQRQLNQGHDILKDPFNFLKSQMHKETLKRD